MFKLVFYESHTSHERAFLGGKGAALFKLKKKGPYPIPQTLILSSEGIQKWIQQFKSYEKFRKQWLENKIQKDHDFFSELKTKAFDPSLKSIIQLLLEQLPDGLIARSSMSVEDHEDFSLAGHFESVFVPKAKYQDIETAIRKVIISGYALENLYTLNAYGVHPDDFLVAVVFQPILKANFSGVIFSINPQAPWEKQAVIEWVKGHLSGLVHGEKDGMITHEKEIGKLDELEREVFKELVELTHQAEKVFDRPLDIEWIFDGRTLWIIQARPITQDEVQLSFKTKGKRRWSRELTLERFPGKMTPMGWSSLKTAFQSNLEVLNSRMGISAKKPEDIAIMFRHIIYSDPAFFSFPNGIALKPSFFLNPFRPYLWKLLGAAGLFVIKKVMGKMSEGETILFKIKVTKSFLKKLINDIQQGWRSHVEKSMKSAESYLQNIQTKDQLTPSELANELNKMNAISMSFLENDLPIYIIKETFYKMLENLWSKGGLPAHDFFELFAGAEGNVTIQMGNDIATLSDKLKGDENGLKFLRDLQEKRQIDLSTLKAVTQKSWLDFMQEYGHHTVSWDVAVPTWGEDPSMIASLLIRQVESSSAPMVENKKNEMSVVAFKKNYEKHWEQIEETINLVKSFMLIDEEQHFLSGRLIPPSRQLILKMGECLVTRLQIKDRHDVFFLSLEEVANYLSKDPMNLQELIAKRKQYFDNTKIEEVVYELGNGPQIIENDSDIKGLAVSPGTVEAKAYWITGETNWKDLPRDFIMLIDSPNPIFIPLYRSIKGIVTMSGGYLSHGFVCAREYQLPAVSQVKNLPTLIKNGDLIKINGTTGNVEIISEVGKDKK